ncbi:hypothetical protein [Photorhabdus australis]|uniref:hypothetical protein n=1 Tax=Photorhabdus australis TaxID=286156 RepID=UPI0030DB52CF
MLPGIRSLAAAMHLEIYWVYTCYLSSCLFVGCVHLPPPCNLKSIGYIAFTTLNKHHL